MAHSKLTDKQKAVRAIRQSDEHKAWSNAVRTRDGFICRLCGKKPTRRKSVHAHHIIPFSKSAEHRFDVSNGITLCRKCHRRVHAENIVVTSSTKP